MKKYYLYVHGKVNQIPVQRWMKLSEKPKSKIEECNLSFKCLRMGIEPSSIKNSAIYNSEILEQGIVPRVLTNDELLADTTPGVNECGEPYIRAEVKNIYTGKII